MGHFRERWLGGLGGEAAGRVWLSGEVTGPGDGEGGAGGSGGVHLDGGFVAVEDVFYGPEAHAVSELAFGGFAELEEVCEDFAGDAGAAIGDDDLDGCGLADEGDNDL